ncbi:MAG: haloacid dehalogenase type II [Alphaproteobacteria bacterium]|nr:haloacid dehalogenase type II [Alphaproteobacteria bacterium]
MAGQDVLENVGACVFDAYGTLFDVHSAAAQCRDDLGDQADALSALWRQKQLEYTWLRSLMGAHTDFWHITGDALDYAMAATGLSGDALREKLMSLYLTLDAYPEVPAVLAALREAGMKTAILSNGLPMMLDAAVSNAGIAELLDAVLSIEDVGVFKVSPKTYQLAVDRLGLEAGRICFMSSNAWDAAGAAHFGFQVAWVNRFGQPRERLPGTPKAEITSLEPLPALVCG